MKTKLTTCMAICGSYFALLTSAAFGQLLYSETFDDGLAANRWTAQAGKGFAPTTFAPVPMDTNFDTSFPADGINDNTLGFSFDYSTVGIPSAPNSTGGSTKGLKLQASLFSNALGGMSANPNGLSLTGDYVLSFDAWSNTIGPMPAGGSGSTNISTFGILSAGTASQTILSSDGVFFGYTADGESSADYRAYSAEDQNSYDIGENPNATYAAGTRNVAGSVAGVPGAGEATTYNPAFGTARTAPQAQIDIFGVSGNGTADQSGVINGGAAGFRWNANEIKKEGNMVTWTVNGTLLVTVDMTNFATPTAGGNISFGHADINFTSSIDPAATDLLFTLVDNIEVNALAAAEDADFDADGDVDGRDFLTWQRNYPITDGTALLADGDANDDGNVDGLDLPIWQTQYGTGPLVAAVAVPEPATLISFFGAIAAMLGLSRRAFSFASVRTN